eukprot:CAMPEP_0116542238 /NCGR_PEP_ID=MMETSP0397-20121206/909_1 /TAXON_ID=216820 /ORGANISM="Cyclophora tenuis, Strain ECT3854" /LENGTH=236 /DNA_ID=CAMNT_0004066233 /DNA_START=51 /DNA_END=761 /DNA_ORIENTATION=-
MDTILAVCLPTWQYCLNLIGDGVNDPAELSGEAMVVEELESNLGTHLLGRTVLIIHRLLVAMHFDRLPILQELLPILVANHKKVLRGHFSTYAVTYVEGIASYKLYNHTRIRKYRKCGRAATKRLQQWVKQGVMNTVPIASCLQAESIAATDTRKRRKADVIREYENAIKFAQDLEVWAWEAQFRERIFELLLRVYGDEESATPYLRAAISSFEKWEAFAKVDSLKNLYRGLLPHH